MFPVLIVCDGKYICSVWNLHSKTLSQYSSNKHIDVIIRELSLSFYIILDGVGLVLLLRHGC